MREEKQLLLEEIHSYLQESPSFVIMRYEGLKANAAAEFRNQAAKVGASVEMVPKRVFLKSSAKAGMELDPALLQGHIGLVFGEDPVELTKLVFDYSKESNGAVSVLGARVDGELLSQERAKALSMLPSKEQLRAQFVGLLAAPMTQTVGVMHNLLTSILYCLENKGKKEQ